MNMISAILNQASREFVVKLVEFFYESNIKDMYKEYQEANKTEIIIWCDGRTKTLPSKSVAVKRKGSAESY